jgi:hypothetical protein
MYDSQTSGSRNDDSFSWFFSNWEMCMFIFPGGENNHLKENHLQEAGS